MALALRAAPAPVVVAARAALSLVVLVLLAAAPASAEPGFEYGEVTRFGGFDSSAYNGGQFGGTLTPGEFLDPTGFAVDPLDNTVYVVDRTSRSFHNPTAWRIQQFSPTGVLLGATTFTLPNGKFGPNSAIEGLAVDHRAGRLYALLVGSPPVSSQFAPVAQELLTWSTTPVAGGLVAATEANGKPLRLDEVGSPAPGSPGTVGGVVSDDKQLLSGKTPLYGPQGIAVDPLEAPGMVDNPVAIEARDQSAAGDTIVQQVATQPQGTAAVTGDLLLRWSGAGVAGQLGGSSRGPHGISTGPDGTLTVLLDTSGKTATTAYVVKLKADFSEATVLNSDANVPPFEDFDEALLYTDSSPYNSNAGVKVSEPDGAGPQVVHLSSEAHGSPVDLYAAIIFSNEPTDAQVSPTGPPGPEYWRPGELPPENFEANIGVRLLEPGAGKAISDLQGRTIVNTLGNGVRLGPCNIGASEAALAAGAGGTLWILDRGPRTEIPEASGQGREVIELAPSASRLCPQPSGTFTMTPTGGLSESGRERLTVPAGTQVTFDASSINRQGGKPFAYEWDLDGNATNGPAGDGFEKVYEMQPPKFYYPPSRVTYMYTRPGEYRVRVRMRTDYGIYTPPPLGTVIVTKALAQPEARFTATASGGQQFTFNAAGSTPGIGTFVNYHWSWGDSGEEDEGPQTPVVAHAYAQPGSYQVRLTVTNSSYQSATSAPQTVTVVASARPAQVVSPLTGPLYAIPPLALYPIPAPGADRTPTRLHPRARFARGALSVTLACPATKALCAGTVSIETAAALAAKSTPKSRRGARRLRLGSARFSIAGGHSGTVTVRLSAKGTALLKSHRRLNVLVIVSAHDSLGDPGTATLGLTLKASAVHVRGSSKRNVHRRR